MLGLAFLELEAALPLVMLPVSSARSHSLPPSSVELTGTE